MFILLLIHLAVLLPSSKHARCVYENHIWGVPRMGVPKTGWFIKENPIQMHDFGVPQFRSLQFVYQGPLVVSQMLEQRYQLSMFDLMRGNLPE